MWNQLLVAVFLAAAAGAAAASSRNPSWDVTAFKNLITFGDSYTDESRLAYFINHNGEAPPVGTYLPEVMIALMISVCC